MFATEGTALKSVPDKTRIPAFAVTIGFILLTLTTLFALCSLEFTVAWYLLRADHQRIIPRSDSLIKRVKLATSLSASASASSFPRASFSNKPSR